MVSMAAETWPESIYQPLANLGVPSGTSSYNPSPVPSGAGPSLNFRAGGYELSVGGAAGSGLFRSGQSDVGGNVQLGGQLAQVSEGIRDGAGRLWGNVRQRMEERASRSNTPPAQ